MSDDAQLQIDLESEIKAVNEWVDAFPLAAVRAALKELQRQRDEIDIRILDLEDKVLVYQSIRPAARSRNGKGPEVGSVATSPQAAVGRRKTPRREAFYKILEAEPEKSFPLAEIRDRLVAMGHMADTKAERHSLQVMASKMFKRGEIARPQDGFYKFLPPHAVAASDQAKGSDQSVVQTNVHGQDGGGLQGRGDPRVVSEGHPPALEGAPDVAHRAGS